MPKQTHKLVSKRFGEILKDADREGVRAWESTKAEFIQTDLNMPTMIRQ